MESRIHLLSVILICEFLVRIFFIYKVIIRRLPVGVSWAWISLLVSTPVLGIVAYFYLGEYRIGRRRSQNIRSVEGAVAKTRGLNSSATAPHASATSTDMLADPSRFFAKTVERQFAALLTTGNDIQLLKDADVGFQQLIADIDGALRSCDLEFYIWSNGGRADQVAEALIRARRRGVQCRVLVDQLGSSDFLKGKIVRELLAAGVEVAAALPAGLIRSLFTRPDLRVHRKIVVVDGCIAYTGSMNLADPLVFKAQAGVGHWVDALCRIQGPAVKQLWSVFLGDWCACNQTDLDSAKELRAFTDQAVRKSAKIQCLPSGPTLANSPIEQTIITAIYSARKKLTLTTPYFVADEALIYGLIAAASTGVEVTLIVPELVDSKLIQYASQTFLSDLEKSGVHVQLFKGGLLHTKSIVVDGEFCLFGSLNLDPRSFRINFEITLAVYDQDFVRDLELLHQNYLASSERFKVSRDLSRWQSFKNDLARLAGPIL